MQEKNWCVYILKCLDGTYYTGVSNNVEKRMESHKKGKGSKYVAAKGFGKLLTCKEFPNKSEALKAEYKIKQLTKKEKLDFFNN